MTEEEVEKLFKGNRVLNTPDKELDEALTLLSNRTSIDSHWIVRALVINMIKNQRHVDKIERRNQFYTIIIIILTLVTIFTSIFTSLNRQNQSGNVVSESIVKSYPDEPNFENRSFKVSSASAWSKPATSKTIKKEANLGDFENVSEAEITNGWPFAQENKKQLDSLGLEKKYYGYFFSKRQVPNLAFEADINGDGIKDKGFTSIGAGCGSCHEQYIDIFIGDDIYSTSGNEAEIYPRQDVNGFYMTEENVGKDGYCCPESIDVSRLEWNRIGFIETNRKTVFITTL